MWSEPNWLCGEDRAIRDRTESRTTATRPARVPHFQVIRSGSQARTHDPVPCWSSRTATVNRTLCPSATGRMMVSPFTLPRCGEKIMARGISQKHRWPGSTLSVWRCPSVQFGRFSFTERRWIFELKDLDETLLGTRALRRESGWRRDSPFAGPPQTDTQRRHARGRRWRPVRAYGKRMAEFALMRRWKEKMVRLDGETRSGPRSRLATGAVQAGEGSDEAETAANRAKAREGRNKLGGEAEKEGSRQRSRRSWPRSGRRSRSPRRTPGQPSGPGPTLPTPTTLRARQRFSNVQHRAPVICRVHR